MASSSSTPEESTIDPELEAGTAVGEYTIEGKLGHGAFGTVYKGVHPQIGKVAAIKVLARKFSVDPEMVSRFKAEAKAVNQIRHKNIIDIFSFGTLEGDGRLYYVMEYLEGEPLDALLDRVGNMSIADALPILRAIAKALDAAHAKGIAHRDLKAENIFLGRDEEGAIFPKLLDFGIAKLMAPEDGLKHKTRTGAPIGTPYYMSPEQCRGKDVDHRTDHYAFGVLMYRMLTGEYPFDGDDYMSILMKQISDPPPLPSSRLPDLPSTIDDVVLWLLAKDPAERPADLRTAVRSLESAAQAAGLDIGVHSGWDAQSSPAGQFVQTQPPPRRASTPVPASASTMQPGTPAMTIAPAPATKSKAPLIAALAGLAVIGAGVFFFMHQPDKATTPASAPAVAPEPPKPEVPKPEAPPPPKVESPKEEAKPANVIVTVTGVPDGTEVLAAGTVIGAAPGPVQLPFGTAEVVLTFRADGYLTTSKTVTPDKASTVDVGLKKKPGKKATGKSTKDDIINVEFGK